MKKFKNFTKIFPFIVLFVLLGLGLSQVSAFAKAAPKDPEVFKIGFISCITGPVSWIHKLWSRTADTAIDEINAEGGIAGIPMEIIYEDNKTGDPKAALSAMNKLIFMDKIQVSLVSFSSAILAAQPLAAENKVLQINTGGWSPNLLNRPYLFSNKITGDVMVENLVKTAWKDGFKKAAILHPNDTAGVFCMKKAEEVWKKLGGKIVAKETGAMGTTDFRVHLTKIKSKRPDVLILLFYGVDSGYAIKQTRELGIQVPIYGMLWSGKAYKASGTAAEGYKYIDDYWNPEEAGPWAQRFVSKHKKLYGEEKIQPFAVNTYEAIYVIKQLIEEARKMGGDYFKGESLNKVLLRKKRFKSVYGTDLVFRENGSCIKPMSLSEVKADGSTKILQVFK